MPVVEHTPCEGTACVQIVLADELEQFLPRNTVLYERELYHIHITEVVEGMIRVVDVCDAATHAGSEVAPSLAQYHHTATSHILATVVAGTFNHGDGTRVAHTEALAHLTVDIEFAAGGTIESRISGNDVLFGFVVIAPAGRRQDRDTPTTESLAEIVVGLAFQTDVQPFHGEGTKALACRPLELNLDRGIGQSLFTVLLGDDTTEHRT